MTFRCCARNSTFSRIPVVWVRNLNKTCWPNQEYERLKPVRLGSWGPPPELGISVGPQRDEG